MYYADRCPDFHAEPHRLKQNLQQPSSQRCSLSVRDLIKIISSVKNSMDGIDPGVYSMYGRLQHVSETCARDEYMGCLPLVTASLR